MKRMFALMFMCCALMGGLEAKVPKVLVLIITSDDQPVYAENQKIWRSYMHLDPEHVESYFIKYDPNLSSEFVIKGDIIWLKGTDSAIPGMLNKTLSAMEIFLPRIRTEFDFVLRTNLSSFFVFPRLLKFLESCPRRGLYTSGGSLPGNLPPFQREYFGLGSGCGFIFSPDIVELIVEHMPDLYNKLLYNDDVWIGQLLHIDYKIPIFETQRMDLWGPFDWAVHNESIPPELFHFRIKYPVSQHRLLNDVWVLKRLLERFYPEVKWPCTLFPSEESYTTHALSQ